MCASAIISNHVYCCCSVSHSSCSPQQLPKRRLTTQIALTLFSTHNGVPVWQRRQPDDARDEARGRRGDGKAQNSSNTAEPLIAGVNRRQRRPAASRHNAALQACQGDGWAPQGAVSWAFRRRFELFLELMRLWWCLSQNSRK